MRLPCHKKRIGVLLVLLLSTLGHAHIPAETGEALQFYSYKTSTPPVINGSLTDATNPQGSALANGPNPDEWKDAAVRKIDIVSADGFDTIQASLFLMSDADFLYVGLTTNFGNSSSGTYIELLFDQGIGGGNHNDLLEGGGAGSDNGEYATRVYPNNGQKSEFSFNGTTWEQQNAGAELFEGYGENLGTSFIQAEYKIPLKPGNATGDGESYLNIDSTGELGMFISFFSQGGGIYYTWRETNNDVNDAATAPGWMDLQLGVPREYTTFYSTFNANGNPVVDGNIMLGATADDAWRGSYRRDILLTDYQGNTIEATVFGCEDNTNQHVYIGVQIKDEENDAGDLLEIYQEQDIVARPNDGRNYLLDNGAENSLIGTEGAMPLTGDRHWDGGTESWIADGAGTTTQSAEGKWYASESLYEYEFLIDRGSSDGQDIQVNNGGLVGFLIRYHDETTNSDYYWEFSPNSDAVELDLNANIFTSAGWAELQFGAPYVQVIFPEDDKVADGAVNIRIYAEDENPDGIANAIFHRIGFPGQAQNFTRINGTNEWSSTWNTLSLPDGPDTLVVSVTDDDGITIDRLVPVTINNDGGLGQGPWVTMATPTAGTAFADSVEVLFSDSISLAGSPIATREVSIDGGPWDTTGVTDSSYTIITTGWENGSHTVAIRVTDGNGQTAETAQRLFVVDNEAPLLADPQVVYPSNITVSSTGDTLLVTALVRDIHAGLATADAVQFTSSDIDTIAVTLTMVDDGSNGDKVANDNIYSIQIVPALSVDTVTYSVTATDILANTITVTSKLMLDNTDPVISTPTYLPTPTVITTGESQVYDERLIIKGSYSDAGGSGLSRVSIVHVNDNGDHLNNSPLELSVDDSLYSRALILIEGINIITVTAEDMAGNSMSITDTIEYVEPKVSATIGSDGGTVTSQNGVSVDIPEDALLGSEEITITKIMPYEQPSPNTSDIELLQVAHEFGPDELTFRKDVEITLVYTDANLDLDQDGTPEIDPMTLSIVFWDGDMWRSAGVSTVDTATQTVSVFVNHFTMYDLAVVTDDTPTEAYGYWESNPVSHTRGGLFTYRIPEDGEVSLQVFDMSGDLVYQLIPKETPVVMGVHSIAWRGQNVAEQFAGAGIYIYIFTYESDDGSIKEVVRKPVGLVK